MLAAPVLFASTQLPAGAEDAEPAIQEILTEAVDAAEVAAPIDDGSAEIPADADDPVVLDAVEAEFTFDVPGDGEGSRLDDGLTTVYDGAGTESSVAVQPVQHGARALVVIDGDSAPERFRFPTGGDTRRLEVDSIDGIVTAYDGSGTPIASTQPAWAVDANGRPVATHDEVDDLTLVQVVDHHDASVAYPITADPAWAAIIAAVAWNCARGALVTVPSSALLNIYHGRASSWSGYVENAVVGCLLGPVGSWTWRFLPGRVKSWAVRQVIYTVIYVIRRVR